MVFFAVMGFSKAATFPGPQSFLALGGAFILCVFQDQLDDKFWSPLTNSVSQHLGRISYSWYLWHWPFVSFYFIYGGQLPQGLMAFVILVFGYICGVLSYHCVERAHGLRWMINDGRSAVASVLIFATFTSATGMFFIATGGALFRYDSVNRPYLIALSSNVGERCGFIRRFVMLGSSVCQRAHGDAGRPILLIGDSHSNMVRPLLTRMAEEANRSLYVATDICRPTKTGSAFCPEGYLPHVRGDIEKLGIGSVVIAARWPFEFDLEDYNTIISHFSNLGLELFIMQSPPEGGAFEPSLSNADRYGDVRSENEIYATDGRERYLSSRSNQVIAFQSISSRRDVKILRVADSVCPSEDCLFAISGRIIFTDEHHISEKGAEVLRAALQPVFGN